MKSRAFAYACLKRQPEIRADLSLGPTCCVVRANVRGSVAEPNHKPLVGWLVVLTVVGGLLVFLFVSGGSDEAESETENTGSADEPARRNQPETAKTPRPAPRPRAQHQGGGGAPSSDYFNTEEDSFGGAGPGPGASAGGAGGGEATSAALQADDSPEVTRLAAEARELVEQKQLLKAREASMKCLALDRDNDTCWQARIRSYTRGAEIPETQNILRYCLGAAREELDCLRSLRQFHLDRGESMQGSSLSAEIKQFYPDYDPELPKAP